MNDQILSSDEIEKGEIGDNDFDSNGENGRTRRDNSEDNDKRIESLDDFDSVTKDDFREDEIEEGFLDFAPADFDRLYDPCRSLYFRD